MVGEVRRFVFQVWSRWRRRRRGEERGGNRGEQGGDEEKNEQLVYDVVGVLQRVLEWFLGGV